MYKAAIVDDELHCTETLAMIIKQHFASTIDVSVKYNDAREALKYLLSHDYDLLFLDIEMPGINGFELLSKLMPLRGDVIFVTAYDHYAVKAFSYSATHYLMKPVVDSELVATLENWLQKKDKKYLPNQYELMRAAMLPNAALKTKIALPAKDGLEFIEISDIVRCEADNNYTHIYCTKDKYLICRTLKEVEKVLAENNFIRVHQSHLVNPAFIKKLLRNDGGLLVMMDGAEISISRARRDTLYEMLSNIEKL